MKDKPKYNIFQNAAYVCGVSWRVTKGLLISILLLALFELSENLVQLYLAPVILQKVENGASLSALLFAIVGFTVALMVCAGVKRWLMTSKVVFTNRLYHHFFILTNYKATTTSYTNTLDTRFLQLQEQVFDERSGNAEGTPPVAMVLELGTFLGAVVGFAVYLCVLTGLEPVLVAVTLVTTVVSFFVNRHMNRWSFAYRDEEQQYVNEMMYPVNTVRGRSMAKDICIFHMQEWLMTVLAKGMELYRQLQNHQEQHLLLGKIADVVLTTARNAVAYGYLLHMVVSGDLSASMFLLYFSAVGGFTSWITTILNSVIQLQRKSEKLCRVRSHLEWNEPFHFEEAPDVPRRKDERYELRLENVTYRYPGSDKNTIDHMNLTIHPGEKIAVVGLNGAGKTTLVKLLCGLLDPSEGKVLLNGEDIRQYNRRDYYRLFTAVFQDMSLFQESIAANIAQSITEIDREKVLSCVQRAGFSDAVQHLPKGIDTNLGKLAHDDAVELSGGQTQRLMLARALYKNAPILLLDEPTAALDPIAENDMYLRYHEITQGRTAIYISHRLASTRFCDRILFLAQGKIAEEGTHGQLMQRNGEYAKLFEVQSRYYREGGAENEEEE